MTVQLIQGDLFDTSAKHIVNTVNCVGVMGSGIAGIVKLRYRDVYDQYTDLCHRGLVYPGKVIPIESVKGKTILNVPTKVHWNQNSSYEIVWLAINSLVDWAEKAYVHKGVREIATPLLGTGAGLLDNDKVRDRMITMFEGLDTKVMIYELEP